MIFRFPKVVTVSFLAVASGLHPASADVGIVLYESKGVDARRTDTGHIALISTNLCAEGIDKLRPCQPGERSGVVVTRYANLAAGYANTVFVAPILDHFAAIDDPDRVPVISSGGTLEAMQMEYWRKHLREYLPPLSQRDYEAMKEASERFDAARLFRQVMTFEFLGTVLGSHKKHYPTEPFALIDPQTHELIPNGRWREAIGVQHMRNTVIIMAPVSSDEEMRLAEYIGRANEEPFQVLTDNCSDFVKRGLLSVYADSGLQFRARSLQVADAWITSPLGVATDFLSFLKRKNMPITVTPVPMLAGTRRTSAPITSISRGALIPNTSQGKIAFALKIYINTLNPLLGITSFVVDAASQFADLRDLVHQHGSGNLEGIEGRMAGRQDPIARPVNFPLVQRERNRIFGTVACWRKKREQFATLAEQAKEFGTLTPAENALLLKGSRPFLLPRLYEANAAARNSAGVLMAGIQELVPPNNPDAIPGGGSWETTQTAPLLSESSLNGFVPGRAEIREMSDSDSRARQIVAFKLMTSVINHDLASEVGSRRTTDSFDADWKLLLEVAERSGLRVAADGDVREGVAACSCKQFDDGTGKTDARGQEQKPLQRMARQGREILYGPAR